MLKNAVKLAWRNLFNHKFYSCLNLIGLATGLVSFIFIALWVRHELSFDKFHDNADRIYRVVGSIRTPSESFTQAVTSPPMAKNLVAEYPEVHAAVRLNRQSAVVANESASFVENRLLLADDTFFEIFSFDLLRGDTEKVLSDVNTLVLTESTARKYFGDTDPIGKILTLDNEIVCQVTGVAADPPANSHIQFDLLLSFVTWEALQPQGAQNWTWNGFYTYLLMPENFAHRQFSDELTRFGQRHFGDTQDDLRFEFMLQPLPDIHLQSNLRYEIAPPGSMAQVYIFATIGLFVLLIACFNYINLATARSIRRARETGVQKALGAHRRQLVLQYLLESFVFTTLAALFAVGLLELLLPLFQSLSGTELDVNYDVGFLAGLIVLVATVSAIAGSYPALVLAGFDPIIALKGEFTASRAGVLVRKVLVVGQFAISIALIATIITINRQLNFLSEYNLGFSKEALLIIDFEGNPAARRRFPAIKQRLLSHHAILGVTGSNQLIVNGLGNSGAWTVDGKGEPTYSSIYRLRVDSDFLDVYGMEIVAGRGFSKEFRTDSLDAFVVNEAAVESFGWGTPEQALGKPFRQSGKQGNVIGVIADFNFASLRQRVDPLALTIQTRFVSNLALRISGKNVPKTLEYISETWREMVPEVPLQLAFMDEAVDAQYRSEQRFGNVLLTFSTISIIVACLGLLGLAAYAAEQRAKEIGIRKVLGATVANIVALMSGQFLRLVLWAGVLAVPAVYWLMQRWLDGFAYRISITPDTFLVAGIAAIFLALITVSFQSLKAALANPVESIRHE